MRMSFRSFDHRSKFKMVLGKKVFAESDPNDEEDDYEDEDDDSFRFVEGPPPDDDENCFCFCFCDNAEDGTDEPNCECYCFCEDPEEEEEEEDLVDPQDDLKEQCSERKDCQALKERLDECNARVESKSKTSETCVEEIIDFMHCVDHCVSKSLFSKLK